MRNWVEALADVEHVLRSGVQLLLAMSFRKDAPTQEQRTETSDVMFLLKKGGFPYFLLLSYGVLKIRFLTLFLGDLYVTFTHS